MGYLRGVIHGAVIGGAVALLYAPKAGRQTRAQLSERLDQIRGQVQPVIDQAQDVVETARPQVERGISRAQQQAQKITRRGNDSGGTGGTAYAGPASMGGSSVPGPGV